MSLITVSGEDVRVSPEKIPSWYGGPQRGYERPRTLFSSIVQWFGSKTREHVAVEVVAETPFTAPEPDNAGPDEWTDGTDIELTPPAQPDYEELGHEFAEV